MSWKPDVTVAAIIERAGKFLVVEERIRGRLVFNQPAGHLEDGETLLQAIVRETLEETAWRFTPEALLGVYLWRSPRRHTTLRFAFIGTVSDHDPRRALDPPVLAAHWFTRDELRTRSAQLRSDLVMRSIDDYLAGRRFELAAIGTELHRQQT
jgi:8-oxo-dGTP pyrophosphatase MutT (NUDIX family)